MEIISSVFMQFIRAFAVVGLILALLQCFFGYRLIRFWISLAGFLVGFLSGYGAASVIFANSDYAEPAPLIAGVIVGTILAAAAFKLYLAGLFVYCGLLALSAARSVTLPEGDRWVYLGILLYLVAFFAAGMLAVRFERPIIILITAVSGAANASVTLAILLESLERNSTQYLAVLLTLTAAGLLVQLLTTSEKGKKRKRKADRK